MSGPAQLHIEVSDTGCGIPKSFRAGLFQPFQQANTSLARPRQGTGLGLSIVKHLVQRMSGTIDVHSIEGEGSAFIVHLPVTLQSRAPSPAVALPLPAPPAPAQGGKRIRVVYRDSRTQQRYVQLWARYGYAVVAGAHTASAEELARGVDAVWTDAETVSRSPALRSLMGAPSSRDSLAPSTASVSTEDEEGAGAGERAGECAVLFVVHSDANDLAPLEPELGEGRNVVLVKRPVIMHTVAGWLDAPAAHMGAHIRHTKVRFALPVEDSDDEDGDGGVVIEMGGEGERREKAARVGSPTRMPPPALKEKAPLRVEIGRTKGRVNVEIVSLPPAKAVVEEARLRVLLVEDNLVGVSLVVSSSDVLIRVIVRSING